MNVTRVGKIWTNFVSLPTQRLKHLNWSIHSSYDKETWSVQSTLHLTHLNARILHLVATAVLLRFGDRILHKNPFLQHTSHITRALRRFPIELLFFHSRHNFPDSATVKKIVAYAAALARAPRMPHLLQINFALKMRLKNTKSSLVPKSSMEVEEKNKCWLNLESLAAKFSYSWIHRTYHRQTPP